MITTVEFVLFFYAGYAIGAWRNRKPPVIENKFVVDPKFTSQMNREMVQAWLNHNGLTWMPKGAVYDPGKSVKK